MIRLDTQLNESTNSLNKTKNNRTLTLLELMSRILIYKSKQNCCKISCKIAKIQNSVLGLVHRDFRLYHCTLLSYESLIPKLDENNRCIK